MSHDAPEDRLIDRVLFPLIFAPFEAAQGKHLLVRLLAATLGLAWVMPMMVLVFPAFAVCIFISAIREMGKHP
jgi:hypothetical protein